MLVGHSTLQMNSPVFSRTFMGELTIQIQDVTDLVMLARDVRLEAQAEAAANNQRSDR
jgi:hypothetical protein